MNSIKFELIYSVTDTLYVLFIEHLQKKHQFSSPQSQLSQLGIFEAFFEMACLHLVPHNLHPASNRIQYPIPHLVPQHLIAGLLFTQRYVNNSVHESSELGSLGNDLDIETIHSLLTSFFDVFLVCVGLAMKMYDDSCMKRRMNIRLVELFYPVPQQYEASGRARTMNMGGKILSWMDRPIDMSAYHFCRVEETVLEHIQFQLFIKPTEFGQFYVRHFKQHQTTKNLSNQPYYKTLNRCKSLHNNIQQFLKDLKNPSNLRSKTSSLSSSSGSSSKFW
eukprot:gb/GECH01014367.1/.p1 GENE.gb/GECH01014367.1/~~gb/GECH01014367.1/.p1  ORF type:complete len:277 (+),score=79.08 gb/GECH01014367.1/:1-831(+)